MNNFFNTLAGKKVINGDIPKITKALETIAQELSEIRKLKQKELNIDVVEEKEPVEEDPIEMNDYLQRILRPMTPIVGTHFLVLKDYQTEIKGDNSERVFKKGHEVMIVQNCSGYLRFEVVGKDIQGVNISLMSYKRLAGQNILKMV